MEHVQNNSESPRNTTLSYNDDDDTLVLKNDVYEGTTTITLYVILGLLGTFGNSFAIFILSKSATMRKKLVNMFLINQSAVDLMASVLLLTIGYIKNSAVLVTFSGVGADFFCKFIGSKLPLWSMLFSSTINLVFVNIERFLSVVFPIYHKTSVTKVHIISAIVFVWLSGLTMKLSLTGWTSGFVDGACKTSALWPSKTAAVAVGVVNVTMQFFVPLLMMSFCHICMFLKIRTKSFGGTSSTTTGTQGQGSGSGGSGGSSAKNIFKTLAIVTIIYAACWVLNSIFFFLYLIGYIERLSGPVYHVSVYLVFFNCCVNPIIYSAQYKDFQDQIKKLFLSRTKVGPTGSSSAETNTTNA